MPSNPSGPIRRSQLIAPFGPGSMVTVPGGTSLVIGGLDYWFPESDRKSEQRYDEEEFKFEEWRLQRLLGVGHFRLPPDYRTPGWGEKDIPNVRLTIPAFRFPTWHFCSSCNLLEERSPTERGRIKCPECQHKGRTCYMYQVPFVAMCENGHLQDFPWREWVHRSANPNCNSTLRLIATGSATLAGQKVQCDKCGDHRSLSGITNANYVTKNLDRTQDYFCQGKRPWLGTDGDEACHLPLKGSLRSAANVYFAQVYSSIYLPRTKDDRVQEILNTFEQNTKISSNLSLLSQLGAEWPTIVGHLRQQHRLYLHKYGDDELYDAAQIYLGAKPSEEGASAGTIDESDKTRFRRAEFDVLRHEQASENLLIKSSPSETYQGVVKTHFSNVMLVDKLKETRALAGFTRIVPDNGLSLHQRRAILWKHYPEDFPRSWLPAYVVYGEGILVEFNEVPLQRWEQRPGVASRIEPLAARYHTLQQTRGFRSKAITPRFVLLHTLAHLLINRLTFECGYSSASLRERLYVSNDSQAPMAAILIYTAAGDSEGTMGGLVRMGKPGSLEAVIERAIEGARWCPADPVCMEVGRYGQGPDSCNLAACHNCTLVPETACEEFNRFLDRGLVVGEINNQELGYFN